MLLPGEGSRAQYEFDIEEVNRRYRSEEVQALRNQWLFPAFSYKLCRICCNSLCFRRVAPDKLRPRYGLSGTALRYSATRCLGLKFCTAIYGPVSYQPPRLLRRARYRADIWYYAFSVLSWRMVLRAYHAISGTDLAYLPTSLLCDAQC
eukprot:2205320-Rhodomonas_salina.2